MQQMKNVPKVVGAAGPASLAKGLRLYRSVLSSRIVAVSSLESAEMVKLAGMVYRDVNIALANEMARYADALGLDIEEVIRLANTDGEAAILSPGVGVGGHCTPVYPYFFINDAKLRNVPEELAAAARRINDSQSRYVAGRIGRALKTLKNKRVLMMGLAFRPDVKEDLYSPAYLLKEAIKEIGGEPLLCDPLYGRDEIEKKGFIYGDLGGSKRIDAAVLITAHKAFSRIDWPSLRARGVKVFVDGRNLFDPAEIKNAGIAYIGIGRR
jgi:nucleotide sugar dehydrogenase